MGGTSLALSSSGGSDSLTLTKNASLSSMQFCHILAIPFLFLTMHN
ncbi:hypothetical protein [uncultured Helicobacter sp.]|nr:hypothetical protein [uncultured Helicobacter sp.]